MKRILILVLAFALTLTAASAESALEAFNSLTTAAGANMDFFAVDTIESTLDEIMNGAYAIEPLTDEDAARIAPDLQTLTWITSKDLASYASGNGLYVGQVRNAYYLALATVLRAEIRVNPASDEKYKDIQTILSLFLEDSADQTDESSRASIRSSMTRDHMDSIAGQYDLPVSFVEFIIMDDDWNDDVWDNDDDWVKATVWGDDYMDSIDNLSVGARDDAGSTSVADLQTMLISLGYLNGKADGIFGPRTEQALLEFQLANGLSGTGIFDDDDYNMLYSADVVARKDYVEDFYTDAYIGTDDYWNSIDNTPDYKNTQTSSSSGSNSKTSSGKTSSYKDTPKYKDSPDYDNTPDYKNSRDYDNTPDYKDSRDYKDS